MDKEMERIRSKAYEIWERDGQPNGRALDHWLEAEGQVVDRTGEADRQDREQSGPSANEGEGNRTAARQYNESQQRFVRSGRVETQAREAEKALAGGEGEELREAERVGKRRAAEEDPAVKR